MAHNNTNVTNADIDQWVSNFTKAYVVIYNLENVEVEIKDYLMGRMLEALFLVAYIESQLAIAVDDEVYDRARELRRVARSSTKEQKSE